MHTVLDEGPDLDIDTSFFGHTNLKPHSRYYVLFQSVFPFFSTFCIIVASVLGTGILGMPVSLALTGFQPFLFTYTIGFSLQALVLCYVVELLEHSQLALLEKLNIPGAFELRSDSLDSTTSTEPEPSSLSFHVNSKYGTTATQSPTTPDLHVLSSSYLSPTMGFIYSCCIYISL